MKIKERFKERFRTIIEFSTKCGKYIFLQIALKLFQHTVFSKTPSSVQLNRNEKYLHGNAKHNWSKKSMVKTKALCYFGLRLLCFAHSFHIYSHVLKVFFSLDDGVLETLKLYAEIFLMLFMFFNDVALSHFNTKLIVFVVL